MGAAVRLTPRQREVVELVGRGLSNKAISLELDLSVHTVERHVSDAAARIPLEGPPRFKCILWALRRHAA